MTIEAGRALLVERGSPNGGPWNLIAERAILTGQWDGGSLIRAVMEEMDELPDDV